MKTFSTQTFIGGLIAGILLSVAWFYGNASWGAALVPKPAQTAMTAAPQIPATLTSATSTATSTSAALSVTDQPAGGTVQIESVTVPPPGVWIAIREVSAGALGNILGAARAGGPRSRVSVPLLRATMPGRTYAVELYRPANATSTVFDLKTASVYVDLTSSRPVIAYFNTID